MNDDEKYINEMKMLTERRKAENEKAWNELAIEKQRTKTEKAKLGTGKIFTQQCQKAIDAEIQGVEYCEHVSMEAGMLIEDAAIDGNGVEMCKDVLRRRNG